MIDTTSPEFRAHTFSGSQTKVRDGKAKTVLEAEDVLRLQVAVVDVQRMAVLNCIEQLKEDLPDKIVISEISSVMEDLREEVTVWTVVHDDPGILLIFDDAMKGHNARMCRGQLMKGDFADVQLPLASCIALGRVREALDCVRGGVGRVSVDGTVDDAVAAISKNFN